MNLLRKIQYNQFWNIGFCSQTPEELIIEKSLRPVQWLKHPYKDRWFADPFILKVTDSEIVVFVEECPMDNPKGIICELVIDRNTLRLKERYVMLDLDTHLSYPAIIRHEGKVYVYPENGASGKLNLYEYDEENHRLINPICILEEAVADATIIPQGGVFYMTATKFPETQKRLFLYKADSLFGPFKQVAQNPVQETLSCSRNGGDYFHAYGSLYRVAQNCSKRYGGALSIMSVGGIERYVEINSFGVNPEHGRYSLGLHTLNFKDGVCVVDSFGYFFPFFGGLYYKLRLMAGKRD